MSNPSKRYFPQSFISGPEFIYEKVRFRTDLRRLVGDRCVWSNYAKHASSHSRYAYADT